MQIQNIIFQCLQNVLAPRCCSEALAEVVLSTWVSLAPRQK